MYSEESPQRFGPEAIVPVAIENFLIQSRRLAEHMSLIKYLRFREQIYVAGHERGQVLRRPSPGQKQPTTYPLEGSPRRIGMVARCLTPLSAHPVTVAVAETPSASKRLAKSWTLCTVNFSSPPMPSGEP